MVAALIGAGSTRRPRSVGSRLVSLTARARTGWLMPRIFARSRRWVAQRRVITVARSWSRGVRLRAPKSGSRWLRGVSEVGGCAAWYSVMAARIWSNSWLVMPVRVGCASQSGA